MRLDSYTFDFKPDKWTIPRPQKFAATVKTYSGFGFFSWGLSIVGMELLLEWELLSQLQFTKLDEKLVLDTTLLFEPCAGRLTHGAVTNGPFQEDRIVTGVTSGATATIAMANSTETYLDVVDIVGTFQGTEVIRDNGFSPPIQATLSAVSVPKYNVEIISLDGQYVEAVSNLYSIRSNVILHLVIKEQL